MDREGFERLMFLFDSFRDTMKESFKEGREDMATYQAEMEEDFRRLRETSTAMKEELKDFQEALKELKEEIQVVEDESDVKEIEDSTDLLLKSDSIFYIRESKITLEEKIKKAFGSEVTEEKSDFISLQMILMEKKEKKKKKKKTTDEEDYTKNVKKETYRSEEIAGKDYRRRKWKGMKYWQKVRFKHSRKRKTQAIKKVKRDKMHRIHRRMKKNKRQSHRRPAKKRGRAQQVPEKKIRYSWKHLLKSICHLRKFEKKESRPLKKMKFGGGFKVEIAFAGMLTKRKKKKAMKKSCVKKRE